MSIDNIIALEDDQMTNMFELVFPTGIPGADDTDNIALRMDSSVEPPEDSVNVYEIFHKGMKVTKTGTMDEMTKELSFEVRLDQNWKAYDDLKQYKDAVFNSNAGTRLPSASLRTTIAIQAYDGQENIVKTLFFKGAILKGLQISSFDQGTGDPVKLTLTWIFQKFVVE